MTDAQRRALLYVAIAALAGIVLCVLCATIASAEQCMCPAPEPPVVLQPLPQLQPGGEYVFLPSIDK